MSNVVAQQLIARLWEKMSDGTPYFDCITAEMDANPDAGIDVWKQVDQHFAERAAHPEDGSDA